MPAEVGYGPSVNLAAEASRPPQVAQSVTKGESDDPQRQRLDALREEQTSGGDGDDGSTTPDRGQNVNITA